ALPFRRGEGWQGAGTRLPLHDREARFRKPCRAADQHHGKHHGGHGQKPYPDGAAVALDVCGGVDGRAGHAEQRYGVTMSATVLAGGGSDHIVVRAVAIEPQQTAMPIRIRKLLGAVALIALVVMCALLAMAVAQFPVVKANGLLETIYYVLAGLGWVLPAMPLIRWMSRGESRRIGEGPVL